MVYSLINGFWSVWGVGIGQWYPPIIPTTKVRHPPKCTHPTLILKAPSGPYPRDSKNPLIKEYTLNHIGDPIII